MARKPRRNYFREAALMCATDLAEHFDNAEGFRLESVEPDCSDREALAFRKALMKVIQRVAKMGGEDWGPSAFFDNGQF